MPLALLAALVLCAAPASPPPDGTTLKLKPNAERVIKVPGLARIAIGDPEVADVRPKGSTEISIRGLVEGRTELLVWTASGSRFRYPIIVGNPKTAPENAQTHSLDAVVSANSAGTLEEQALTMTVGEEKALKYSDVSKVAVTQYAPTVEVAPLDTADGIRVKAIAVGTAKVTLHIGGRPAVRLDLTILDPKAKGPDGNAGPAKAQFGGQALPKPDCTGDTTTAETARMVAEATDFDRAKKFAQAIEKLENVVALQPSAAHAYLKLGTLYARVNQQEKGATAYETFALSCPTEPMTAKVRQILEAFRKEKK